MRIDGLTDRQVAIADRLWEMDTEQQCNDWILSLEPEDAFTALTLMELMIISVQDENIDTMTVFEDAERMLENIGVSV